MTIIKGKTYYDMPVYKSISDLFKQSLNKHTNNYALTYRDSPELNPISLTYRDLADRIEYLNLVWSNLGMVNKRFAIVGDNSSSWVTSYLAAAESQSMVIPLDNLLPEDELGQLIIRSKADVFSIDALTLIKFSDNLESLIDLSLIQIMNIHKLDTIQLEKLSKIKTTLSNIEFIEFTEVLQQGEKLKRDGEKAKFQPIDPDAVSILIFTSGTTAMSKGVLLTQRSIVTDVAALHGIIDFPDKFRSLSFLPLNHTFECTCGILAVLSIGGHIHMCDGLRYIQQNLQEYDIQIFIGVPAVFDSMYKRIMLQAKKQKQLGKLKFGLKLSNFLRFFKLDLRRKIFSEILSQLGNLEMAIIGAAPMKVEQINFFTDIGIRVFEGYGLTETSPVAAANNDFVFIPGSVGEPIPGVEIKIDSEGKSEPGEILIKGPVVMQGYYENPEETTAAFTEDGWFRSGDLGLIDHKTNSLKITGRIKSMIVLDSGKKIYPEEIEQLIKEQDLELIKDSLVFVQKTDNKQDILSVKFVIDKEKAAGLEVHADTITKILDKLLDDVNKRIPDFKRIKTYFYSYKDMISTSTLKVKRDAERQHIESIKKELNLRWDEISKKNIDLIESKLLKLNGGLA